MEEIEKCILGLLDGGQGRFTIPDVIGDVAANERQVREAISDLRKRGILIIKDQFGFYRLAQNASEIFKFTTEMRTYIRSMQAIVAAMESSAKRTFKRTG